MRVALRNLKASVSRIRKYAGSFVGLNMKEVRARLGDVKLTSGKWQSSGFGGPELLASLPDYEFSVLFYDGKVITTSFRVFTS